MEQEKLIKLLGEAAEYALQTGQKKEAGMIMTILGAMVFPNDIQELASLMRDFTKAKIEKLDAARIALNN